MDRQKFSVAMCVYGGDDPRWFAQAVDSILNQTAKPDEVVLVVDGPVPETLDAIIRGYGQDPVFRVVRLAENQGHGNARRASLANCTNELVALMDADDLSVPDRFEKQLAMFAARPDADIVGGMIDEFVESPEQVVGARHVPCTDEEIKVYLKDRCPMNQVTVMFKKSSVDAVGGYVDWYNDEDYYLWVRMYLAGMKFANTPDILVHVRVGADMYRRRGGWRYFKSEAKLQKYMWKNGVIGFATFAVNVAKRLIVQVLLPNRIRGWVFKAFARSKA